jgi:hypothetical protein
MSINIFAELSENNITQHDEAIMKYIHTSYYQHRPLRTPLLHTLLNCWRRFAMMCVCDSMWRIDWPYEERSITVKPDQVPYSIVVDDCGSEEKANRFIEVTIAVQVWLPSSRVDPEYWWEYRNFPWVHRYVRDVLAYQWAVQQIEANNYHSLRHAYRVLGNLPNHPETIPYLEAALQHPDLNLRRDAIEPAIKKIGHKVVPFLLQSMGESYIYLKEAAIEALGQFPDPENAEALLAQLEMEMEAAPYVRSLLVEALGKMRDKRTIEPLTALLQNPNENGSVRGKAAIIIASLDPQMRDVLQPYLEDDTLPSHYRAIALKILGQNQ